MPAYLNVVRESEKRLANMKKAERRIDVGNFTRPGAGANLDEQVESMLREEDPVGPARKCNGGKRDGERGDPDTQLEFDPRREQAGPDHCGDGDR